MTNDGLAWLLTLQPTFAISKQIGSRKPRSYSARGLNYISYEPIHKKRSPFKNKKKLLHVYEMIYGSNENIIIFDLFHASPAHPFICHHSTHNAEVFRERASDQTRYFNSSTRFCDLNKCVCAWFTWDRGPLSCDSTRWMDYMCFCDVFCSMKSDPWVIWYIKSPYLGCFCLGGAAVFFSMIYHWQVDNAKFCDKNSI